VRARVSEALLERINAALATARGDKNAQTAAAAGQALAALADPGQPSPSPSGSAVKAS
jgi:hypothetical protein